MILTYVISMDSKVDQMYNALTLPVGLLAAVHQSKQHAGVVDDPYCCTDSKKNVTRVGTYLKETIIISNIFKETHHTKGIVFVRNRVFYLLQHKCHILILSKYK